MSWRKIIELLLVFLGWYSSPHTHTRLANLKPDVCITSYIVKLLLRLLSLTGELKQSLTQKFHTHLGPNYALSYICGSQRWWYGCNWGQNSPLSVLPRLTIYSCFDVRQHLLFQWITVLLTHTDNFKSPFIKIPSVFCVVQFYWLIPLWGPGIAMIAMTNAPRLFGYRYELTMAQNKPKTRTE